MIQNYEDYDSLLSRIACYKKESIKSDNILLPPWIDKKRFKECKSILEKHFFSILLTHLCGLILLVFVKSIHNTLSMTGKSNNLVSLFRRYVGTLQKIKLWYRGDILDCNDPAYKSLLLVRQMHQQVAISQNRSKVEKKDELSLSQRDMVVTQFAFIGLIVLFPKQMGFPVDREDLDKLIYFWRCIGYLLGIDDQCNLCTGDYQMVRQNCQNILNHHFVPSLTDMNKESLSMSQQIVFTTQQYVRLLRFNSVMKYLLEVMNISNTIQLSPMETFSYNTLKYALKFIHYRFVTALFNILLRLTLYKLEIKWIVYRIEHFLKKQDDHCNKL